METPRLGMRFGSQWYLKPGVLYSESGGAVFTAPPTEGVLGVTPQVPSIKAAVNGISTCYGHNQVMGTDPEFFVSKDGQIVPAFDFLPDKYATEDGLFWDGFQAETTVDLWHFQKDNPKYYKQPEWAVRCHAVLAIILGKQIRKLRQKGLNIVPQGNWRIPTEMLNLASDAHVALGCDPSRNAYGLKERKVHYPRKLLFRFCGGHIHFQLPLDEREEELIRYLVKTLDIGVGIPAVCLAQNYDHWIRRRYYGLPGEYRLPPHGLEWRTLSNFWLMHPRVFMLVFDLARHVFNIGRARLRNVFVGGQGEKAVRDTIMYNDVRSAKDFMRLNKEFYTSLMELQYGSAKPFWEAINGGVDKVIPNWGKDVVGDWFVGDAWTRVPAWKDLS